jgi:DNA invertase Pin-like site-specific DNA recombinase
MRTELSLAHRQRRALVYVRQSTMAQVVSNLEGKQRQYDLADLARSMGCKEVEVVDDDLGRSGSGDVERPGFQRVVALVCSGAIGAVFCLEASRLARNGRDWHTLLDRTCQKKRRSPHLAVFRPSIGAATDYCAIVSAANW